MSQGYYRHWALSLLSFPPAGDDCDPVGAVDCDVFGGDGVFWALFCGLHCLPAAALPLEEESCQRKKGKTSLPFLNVRSLYFCVITEWYT